MLAKLLRRSIPRWCVIEGPGRHHSDYWLLIRIEQETMSELWKYLKYGGPALTGRVHAGRRLTVVHDEVFLVSYPRSGNTWTRFLIGNRSRSLGYEVSCAKETPAEKPALAGS
jgi:hypothetical protein